MTGETLEAYTDDLLARGIRRIHVLAWRDLDDRDAGGSEVHADEFMRRWASLGLEVTHRTSAAVGLPPTASRNGYRVVRRGSRYSVFPRAITAELLGRMGPYDALVEIWNGVPWFSPVWCRRPRITVLHHVHGPMWNQILPGPLAAAGRALESRFAPPFYRRGLTVTPSDATRDELLELGFRPDRVVAVPNGVDPFFSPGGAKTRHPSILAVGRLAPVKRFELVIDAALVARRRVPGLELTIVGDGPLEPRLAAQVADAGATGWIRLVGRLPREQLLEHYRSAWLVVSGSLAEGWGLSLTEGAACGTPAVATDIRGHRSSVRADVTGVLVPPDRLGDAIADVVLDDDRRARLRSAGLEWARSLTWEASAFGVTRCLHDEVVHAQRPGR
ncbi:MAG: glycosyltransferase family 4 protein [Ilumatobacter sp.]|uniref:glycosyltransferase family 4 protein n=1 Tax=Ilumatobacter sp. TaxID=1967498 RepID=UPI00261E451B|nr:glycosyltransferase family 4 protein [Ilumatobacter sp.]MDJ0767317.1 glycosyltransferase family 4 protein [Ilumatobacter sp.]